MNINNYIVYDYEATSKNPHIAEIFEIGAVALNRNMKIIDEFKCNMKPDNMDTIEDDALRITGKTREDLNGYPPTKIMWPTFTEWVNKYNRDGSVYGAPIPMGYNIDGYDMVVTRRYCLKYKTGYDKERMDQKIFSQIYSFDLMKHLHFWFENNQDISKMKLEIIMEYMGFTKEEILGAHDALTDAKNSTRMIQRLYSAQRYLTTPREDGTRRLEMKGAFTK